MPSIKLIYFPVAGRAESTRAVLDYGNVEFQDVPVTDWPSIKEKMPFKQVPVLEVDGKMLAQSGAIVRYAARLAGLLPSDPWKAALADQAAFVLQDFEEAVVPALFSAPQDQRAAKAKELLEGTCKPKLETVEKLLANLSTPFITGDEVSWADIHYFTSFSALTSGFFGIGPELLDQYPAIKAFHAKIGNLPGVRKRYEALGDARAASYRPSA